MSIVSIPIMVQNSKGNGLKVYNEGKVDRYDIMKFSFANQ
jgi:hypothetical protein